MRRLILAVLFSFPMVGFSQFQDVLTSDRPGQTMSAYTVGAKTLQIQNGINYGESNGTGLRTQNFFDALNLRFGLFEKVELNATLISGTFIDWVGTTKTSAGFRVRNLSAGGRVRVLDGEGFKPNISLQANMSFYAQEVQQIGYHAILATNNSWDIFSVSTNLGVAYDGHVTSPINKGVPYFPYTLSFGLAINDFIGSFAEIFGTFDNIGSPGIDAGLSIVPFDDLQIDLFGGYIISNPRPAWFAELGFSYRLHWRGSK